MCLFAVLSDKIDRPKCLFTCVPLRRPTCHIGDPVFFHIFIVEERLILQELRTHLHRQTTNGVVLIFSSLGHVHKMCVRAGLQLAGMANNKNVFLLSTVLCLYYWQTFHLETTLPPVPTHMMIKPL